MSPLTPNPLPWLLEPENPAVQAWALVDLLARPPDDPEVSAARRSVADLPMVQEVFAQQQPGGHWGEAASPYRAAGTLGVLELLYTLGVMPDERTAAGCDSLLTYGQAPNGGLALTGRQASSVTPCTTGTHLPLLVYFGLEPDARVRRAFRFVIQQAAAPDGLKCGRYNHQPCLWGAIAMLEGLAVLPAALRTPEADAVIAKLAETLLGESYDFAGEHKRWLTFSVPRGWDLLSACRVLAQHGFAGDPRWAALLERVLGMQDAQGRWRCGSASRTWPLERRGQPSKWVTLDALVTLKAAGRGE